MEHVIIYSVDCPLTRTHGVPSQVVGQHPMSQQNRTFRTCINLAQSRGVPRSNLRLRLGGRRVGGRRGRELFEAKGKPRAKPSLSVIPMSKRLTEGSPSKGPPFSARVFAPKRQAHGQICPAPLDGGCRAASGCCPRAACPAPGTKPPRRGAKRAGDPGKSTPF